VITADHFARERVSYWAELLPWLESFVRAVNYGVGRFSPPIAAELAPDRHAFVAEFGFELFREKVTKVTDKECTEPVVERLIERLALLSHGAVPPPTSEETVEAGLIATSLAEFVDGREGDRMAIDVPLRGCGVIDRAAADLLIGRVYDVGGRVSEELLLYEVKVVERSFRAADIRQLLTYGALLTAEGRPPTTVGLVNPRRGTFYECLIESLSIAVSGLHADDLLQRIIFDVSATEISL